MAQSVTFQGKELHLAGRAVKQGMKAPNFKVVSADLKEAGLADFKGKVKILTSFPSIDTPVCDMQVKEFNKQAAGLSQEVVIIGISMDLPFAHARFCQANDIKRVKTFSDYRYSSFGMNYGLLIRELALLARAVLVVDKNDRVRYVQVVGELTHQPDYEDALKNVRSVCAHPDFSAGSEEMPAHCVPCEGGVAPLPKEKVERLLAEHRGWEVADGIKIRKDFTFGNFSEAKFFVDLIAAVAEEEGHHPALSLAWGKVRVTLTTHAAKGLTDNDFIMARIIDGLR